MTMNIKNNKNLRVRFMSMATVLFMGLMGCFLASCDDELDIQQSYPFTVETMPVPNKVTKGQTVEIRCEMKKEGNYANALYTIRYFQFEGEGTLKMDNGITFLPNDRYPLDREVFRLYYTSRSDDQQTIDVYIEDNMGQVVQKNFTFQNDSDTGGEEQ